MNQIHGFFATVFACEVRCAIPDADTDVLVWAAGEAEAQLGAYIGHELDGNPIWVDAQGEQITNVTHWAEIPKRANPAREAPAFFNPLRERKPC